MTAWLLQHTVPTSRTDLIRGGAGVVDGPEHFIVVASGLAGVEWLALFSTPQLIDVLLQPAVVDDAAGDRVDAGWAVDLLVAAPLVSWGSVPVLPGRSDGAVHAFPDAAVVALVALVALGRRRPRWWRAGRIRGASASRAIRGVGVQGVRNGDVDQNELQRATALLPVC